MENRIKMNKYLIDIETTGINPCINRITCIGLLDMKQKYISFMDDNEKNLLNMFKGFIIKNKPIQFIGWRSLSFDFPWIEIRGLKYGINFKTDYIEIKDLQKAFFDFGIDIHSKDICKLLEINGPKEDGSKLPVYWELERNDLILDHNEADLRRDYELFKKIRSVWKEYE